MKCSRDVWLESGGCENPIINTGDLPIIPSHRVGGGKETMITRDHETLLRTTRSFNLYKRPPKNTAHSAE